MHLHAAVRRICIKKWNPRCQLKCLIGFIVQVRHICHITIVCNINVSERISIALRNKQLYELTTKVFDVHDPHSA